MEKINKAFEMVGGSVAKITELLVLVLALAVVGQVLYGAPVFGMDAVGNVVSVINSLGQAGFVGLLAVLLLFGILSKD
jgi:hypothetical protein